MDHRHQAAHFESVQAPEIAAIRELARRHRRGTSLDRVFYVSPIAYELDLHRIWCESWIWAGHVSQIPEAGDYVVFDFGPESVIIVRDAAGDVRAHLNVCRHRGSRVCLQASGNTRVFSCPYHGWAYDLDGKLRAARMMGDGFDTGAYALEPVQVRVFQGLILICMAHHPPALDTALTRLAPLLQPFDMGNLKIACSRTYPVAANWKLALENYVECYHCARAHREYSRSHSLKDPSSMTAELVGGMRARARQAGVCTEELAMTGLAASPSGCDVYHRRYPLYAGYDTGSEDGTALAPLLGQIKSFDGGATDLQIGPFSYFLAYSDHVVGYRFLPRAPQRTDIQTVWMVRADATEGKDYDLDRLTWLWDVTTRDDERIIRNNQQGVNSLRYRPGPLSEMEWGIDDFLQWYTRSIG